MFQTGDTIVAIATPHGRGGIGVVRISGPGATTMAGALVGRDLRDHVATFARLIDPVTSDVLDEVVATRFAGPHSYTGEDVVEVAAHGSPVVLHRIVELAIAHGARLAEPGEFTFRAYLNGRIDLTQAEAVADLVDAVTPLQARAAMDQLEGTLATAITAVDARLFDLTAKLEASLDYPDEGYHFATSDEVRADLQWIRDELARLSAGGRAGRVIREGRTVVILGRPNAGKSSLFNALVGSSRAIVTPTPGTTRDLVTETVDIRGLPITLVDTAGLRESQDEIEAEGVRRARDAERIAAVTLIVIDGSRAFDAADRDLVASRAQTSIVVRSKSDLKSAWTARKLGLADDDVVSVSAVTPSGVEELRDRIASQLTDRDDWRDPPPITNIRHLQLVDEARELMSAAERAIAEGATEELVLTDLTRARQALEEVTGRRTTDDVLTRIFQRFCLGK